MFTIDGAVVGFLLEQYELVSSLALSHGLQGKKKISLQGKDAAGPRKNRCAVAKVVARTVLQSHIFSPFLTSISKPTDSQFDGGVSE
mmetsp:Transcript_17315/g.26408  ORF Transcript_17315/g.26408 Transcript_17315/m.26408 type:complete len:87 (-) Transcript_17315:122-382(-)